MRCFICSNNNTLYLYINDYGEVFSLCAECDEIALELKKYRSETIIDALAQYIADKHQ